MPNTTLGDDRKKTWRLLFIALIFALLAGLGAMVYLRVLAHRLEAKLAPAEKQVVQVVVATRDLQTGSKVDSTTMSVRKIPAEYVNSDVITPDTFNSVDGAILTKPLAHGKMLTSDYIDLNLPKDFSGTVQLGHRAVTIQVGEINSVAGLIRPGNRIDLYTQLPGGITGGPEKGEMVLPVLEDVLVLATDQRSARPNADEFEHLSTLDKRQTYDTLTLEVTPRDAALIAVAEAQGSLLAVLRNDKDKGGVDFSRVGLSDLVQNSSQLLQQAVENQRNQRLDGVHLDSRGRLVTKNGIVITDPNVHLNKDGLLVTKDGTVLSGSDLVVGQDGKIRTKDGKLVDTASLVAATDGTLIDKNGTVVGTKGYKQLKGGFLLDKDGRVLTPDGHVLAGVTVGPDGQVKTRDGKVLSAADIVVDKDGKVHLKSAIAGYHLDGNGKLVKADGTPVQASDLVTVGPDGQVRTKDGRILSGVTVGKDGQLYDANGRKMSAADVLLAEKGLHEDKDGKLVDSSGREVSPRDLVTVGPDGKVRTKDGKVIDGAYVDANGVLRRKDGTPLTARDISEESALAAAGQGEGQPLPGVSGKYDPAFAATIGQTGPEQTAEAALDRVEYIIGGSTSDGVATTFSLQVEDDIAGRK